MDLTNLFQERPGVAVTAEKFIETSMAHLRLQKTRQVFKGHSDNKQVWLALESLMKGRYGKSFLGDILFH